MNRTHISERFARARNGGKVLLKDDKTIEKL